LSRLSQKEMRLPPHCTNATKCNKIKSNIFIIGAFTQLTTIEEWIWGIILRQTCCLRSRQSANLVWLQKKQLIKNRKWGGQLLFTHWLNYGLIRVIEISSSNVFVYRHGGEFSPFVGARIVAGIMQFIANSMMMTPNAPGNVIGRGRVGLLNEAFCVNLPTAVQKTKNVLDFCMRFGNGVSLPHSIYFSYLQHAWDAANVTLQDLMGPAVDLAVNQNDRCCPVCLDLVLSRKFRIPACGHPIHMSCWRSYKDWMTARNQVVQCPVCQFKTIGYCYQVRL
jgi:hypothetical protein